MMQLRRPQHVMTKIKQAAPQPSSRALIALLALMNKEMINLNSQPALGEEDVPKPPNVLNCSNI